MSSVLERLTEGIVSRDLKKEGSAMLKKWEKTGLLEGLGSEHGKATMARLLENQASELLRESSSMHAGDVEGFASVAFPIVRRVFGGLIANDLVSVQPMSLPSGLIFFLDFQVANSRMGYTAQDSVWGGGVVGQQITGGVNVDDSGTTRYGEQGFYALNNGYSSPTGSLTGLTLAAATGWTTPTEVNQVAARDADLRFDPDLASGSYAQQLTCTLTQAQMDTINTDNLTSVKCTLSNWASGSTQVRRLTTRAGLVLTFTFHATGSFSSLVSDGGAYENTAALEFPLKDDFTSGTGLGSVVGTTEWGLEQNEEIPEIDIKVDSVAVTAVTKKLKAKWTPELGQDLNAYHNMDAEVELTSILSEQIALEIDREILEDLIKGATAGTYYWSRRPGKFLNRSNGSTITVANGAPDFTGNVSEWYETLVETMNDVSAQIHRKTLRGGANFIVCGPELANVLEFTSGFRANVTADQDRGTVGAVNVGSLSKKWDIYVDPYFPRNVVLMGRKGSSFLESGYVYAPYVPLQTTPTIFGPEDFVPRKGVLTRYAKKMVRPDMYGLVLVSDLLG